ncbi:MAG: YoaK family protein [Pseudomonadota bacterium]
MPLNAIRALTFSERTRTSNWRLGAFLAFVAGAVNAGGFLVVQRYVSHMTGIVSSIGNDWAAGRAHLALVAIMLLLLFLSGAFSTSVLVNWARRRGHRFEYALPLAIEAALLGLFILMGAHIDRTQEADVTGVAALLCYVMGLQNALVSKFSRAEIRTTHVTGLVTDIGIELGRLVTSRFAAEGGPTATVNRERLFMHTTIFAMFLLGGILGALAVTTWGVAALWPLVAGLMGIALPALVADAAGHSRGQ